MFLIHFLKRITFYFIDIRETIHIDNTDKDRYKQNVATLNWGGCATSVQQQQQLLNNGSYLVGLYVVYVRVMGH